MNVLEAIGLFILFIFCVIGLLGMINMILVGFFPWAYPSENSQDSHDSLSWRMEEGYFTERWRSEYKP